MEKERGFEETGEFQGQGWWCNSWQSIVFVKMEEDNSELIALALFFWNIHQNNLYTGPVCSYISENYFVENNLCFHIKEKVVLVYTSTTILK